MKELLVLSVVMFFAFYGVYQFVKSTFINIIRVIVKIREGKEK